MQFIANDLSARHHAQADHVGHACQLPSDGRGHPAAHPGLGQTGAVRAEGQRRWLERG